MSHSLFGGIDGIKEDAMEFGTVAGAALVGHAAVGYAFKFVGQKFPTLPAWALNAGAILGGALLGKVAGHYGFRRIGLGFAAGAMVAGAAGFVKQYAPSVPLAGVALGDAYTTRALLMGLGDGSADALYQRYLNGAPTQVVDTGGPFTPALNGVSAAPMVVTNLGTAPVVVQNGGARGGHHFFGANARTIA